MKEYYKLSQSLKMDGELYKETIYSGDEYLVAVEHATFNHRWFNDIGGREVLAYKWNRRAEPDRPAYKWNIGIWGWN